MLRRLLAFIGCVPAGVSASWLRANERREMTDLPIIAVWRSPKEIAEMNRRERFQKFAAMRSEQAERRRA